MRSTSTAADGDRVARLARRLAECDAVAVGEDGLEQAALLAREGLVRLTLGRRPSWLLVPERRELWCEGGLLTALSPLQLRLFRALLRDDGVGDQAVFYEEIWGETHHGDGTDLAIRVAVSRLRKRLGLPTTALLRGASGVYHWPDRPAVWSLERPAAPPARLPSPPAIPPRFGSRLPRPELEAALCRAWTEAGLLSVVGPCGVGKSDLLRAAVETLLAEGRIEALGLCWVGDDGLDGVPADARTVVWDDADEASPERLAAWRRAHPEVRLLCSRRRPWTLAGERSVRVPPLGEDEVSALCELRAREVELPARRLEGMARLAPLLGGWPLAADLAAEQLSLWPAEELAELLGSGADLLRSRRVDRPPRHHSLSAAVEVDLAGLSEAGRRGALALAGALGSADLHEATVLLGSGEGVHAVISELVDAGLLRVESEPRGTRFAMVAPVRRVLGRRPSHQDTIGAARARHRAWLASTGRSWADRIEGPEGQAALDWLSARLDVLLRAVEAADPDRPQEVIDLALALFPLAVVRGRLDDPLVPFDRAVAADRRMTHAGQVEPGRTVHILRARSQLRRLHGDPAGAQRDLDHALELAPEAGVAAHAGVLRNLAQLATDRHELAVARAHLEAAMGLVQGGKDRVLEGKIADSLGVALQAMGEVEAARAHLERGLACFVAAGDARGTARLHANLGELLRICRDWPRAEAHFEAARAGAEALGDLVTAGVVVANLGLVAQGRRRPEEARMHFEAALALTARSGAVRLEAGVRVQLARVALAQGREEQAEAALRDAFDVWRRLDGRAADDAEAARAALDGPGTLDARVRAALSVFGPPTH